MIGVKFTRNMRPYGAGDTALLPEDVAEKLVDEGSAELHDFPDAPHAHEARDVPNPSRLVDDRKQSYRIKRP